MQESSIQPLRAQTRFANRIIITKRTQNHLVEFVTHIPVSQKARPSRRYNESVALLNEPRTRMDTHGSTVSGPSEDASETPLLSLPNPLTPMAFLPPELAEQFTVCLYFLISAVTIHAWDIFTHLVDDFSLARRNRARLPFVVYVFSRFTTFAFIFCFTLLNAFPIGHCELVDRIAIVFEFLAVPLSQLLFLLHVRAVYIDNRHLVRLFLLLWLCTIGTSALAPISAYTTFPYSNIGPTKYCIGSPVARYVGFAVLGPIINDTVLFVALSWRLLTSTQVDQQRKASIKEIVLGARLPIISRALFHNGQAYFLTTVTVDIITLVLFFMKPIPLPYRDIAGVPGLVIMNIMASRLYRNINSGVFNRTIYSASNNVAVNCSRQHIEEISLTQIRSTIGSGLPSSGVRFSIKSHPSGNSYEEIV